MNKRRLGQSEIEITPVGLGCWQFSNAGVGLMNFWKSLSQETIDHIIAASIDGGINWFDTAEAYGRGNSENALSVGLKTYGIQPGEVVIATKWLPILRTARSIARTIDERLKNLGGYPIDLYQIHMPYSLSTIEAQMMAMVDLLKQGKIRAVGVSNFNASQMRKAHETLQKEGFSLASNQVQYHLLNRKIETNGVLETAKELGVTIIAYSPLAQGLLTGKFHDKLEDIQSRPGPRKYSRSFQEQGLKHSAPLIDALKTVAEHYDATPAQVALNWLMVSQAETVVVIPGASKVQHAEENIASTQFVLTEADIHMLDEVSQSILS
jgi:aryl-alcohol dehydrogenase-like predicted oxidoreductase